MSIILLLFILGIVAALLYLYNKQYKQASNEPPLFAGIPFMGVALQYGPDPLKFLDACRKKVGDIFTLYLAGQRMTFLHDPLVFQTIFKNSTQFQFHFFAREVSLKAFRITNPTYDAVDKPFHKQYNSYLSGSLLAILTRSLHYRLYQHMVEGQSNEWQNTNLFEWTRRVIFYGSGDSLFGDQFSDKAALDDFYAFDKNFGLFLAGLPSLFYSSSVAAFERTQKRMLVAHEHKSEWMENREKVIKELQISDEQYSALQSSILWAAQANTVPACFWIIAHVLADKQARKEVYEEVEKVMENAERDGDHVIFTADKLAAMVKLDSAISEVLRLHSSPMMVRRAESEGSVTLTNGQLYYIRKGDVLMLSPYGMHHDPEIYSEPEEFQFKRYMNDPKFFKNGQHLKTPLLPFGGGISLCPGRHFARNEMKVFVAFCLYYLDMELLEDNLPKHDVTRAGLGSLPPVGDIPFRFRLKKTPA